MIFETRSESAAPPKRSRVAVVVSKPFLSICAIFVIAIAGILVSGPTLHDEALTMVELSGNADAPWPAYAANSGELRSRMLYRDAGLPTVLRGIGKYDRHPPLYYAFLWLWARAVPHRLLAYRLLSVTFLLLTVLVVAKWTRSAWCTVLLALNPDVLALGTIARDYSLALFWIVIAAWSLDSVTTRKRWPLLAAGISGAIAVWTHFFTIVPVGILVLFGAIRGWKQTRSYAVCSLALFGLLAAPALLLARSQMSTATQTIFPGWGNEIYRMARSLLRYPVNPTQLLPTSLDWLASAAVALVFLFAAFRFSKFPDRVKISIFIVLAQGVFLIGLSAISHQDFSAIRYLDLTLPFCYLLITEIAARSDWGKVIAGLCAIVLVLGCVDSALRSRAIIAARNAVFSEASAKLIIVDGTEIPGMPGAILNDVPNESNFYVLQTPDQFSVTHSLVSRPGVAVYCPSVKNTANARRGRLSNMFPAKMRRMFMGYDCYVRSNR